jgi:flagellar biogenesis protein FliO
MSVGALSHTGGMATAQQATPAAPGTLRGLVLAFWSWILRLGRSAPRRLRLCESLPLGERRFVAVVEFEAARFLVGGTASSLVLLAKLDDADSHASGEADHDERPPVKFGRHGVLENESRGRAS